jgi:hypothetical protein
LSPIELVLLDWQKNSRSNQMNQDLPPAIDACLDLVNDLLHPEVYGHAIPSEVKTRAFVVRKMLERLKARLEGQAWQED